MRTGPAPLARLGEITWVLPGSTTVARGTLGVLNVKQVGLGAGPAWFGRGTIW
jgi:hypothetical protein